jgi:hypothetical protein
MSGETFQVSNGKRPVSNVNKRAKMFAVCAWTQIAVTLFQTQTLLPNHNPNSTPSLFLNHAILKKYVLKLWLSE